MIFIYFDALQYNSRLPSLHNLSYLYVKQSEIHKKINL